MGLFRRNSDNQNQYTQQASENASTKYDDAIDYFSGEAIQCCSDADKETVEKLYSTLKEDNYDTYNDDSLKDAISSLDANLYNLCKAMIYQNFMLMRKVDKLSSKVDQLEKEIHNR